MKIETTPEKITDEIINMCKEIVPETEPQYIQSAPAAGMNKHKSFSNVPEYMKKNGGQQVNGWGVWQWANMFIEAEPYAVWMNSEGKLIDITPGKDGVSRMLFLPDMDNVHDSGRSLYRQLTDSNIVRELLYIGDKVWDILKDYPDPIVDRLELKEARERLKPYEDRKMDIMEILSKKAGRNDKCPCGSGLKYKKCCGK